LLLTCGLHPCSLCLLECAFVYPQLASSIIHLFCSNSTFSRRPFLIIKS
jgi:disulfide bond formation protein DsbB